MPDFRRMEARDVPTRPRRDDEGARETSGRRRRYSGATLHRITYITLAQRGLQPRGNRRATGHAAEYPSGTADGLGTAAQEMGTAHRSARRRAQAIEDRFETLHARRLALSAATVGRDGD